MKGLYFVLAYLCLILNSYVSAINIEKCGSEKQILTIRKFSISPDPIRLSGKDITISVDAQLHEDIPEGARMKIKAWKVSSIFGWKIYLPAPCLVPMGCDVEHCKFFNSLNDDECPFAKNGTDCRCPIKAQTFRAENLVVSMPSIGGAAKWFASGSFWVELTFTTANSEQLACYSITGEAVKLFR
ncbi:ML domain-containing protein [Trichonephila clavata]|uniref:ML domain-containing protein n=1 Tax=Trichonephila clavata TaxID=2740835 RepID=A0A8X6I5V0_TRICU|nr:ML domain-containing protein [Trichonephila clavata]